MNREALYPCKDCDTAYFTAEDFSNHIPDCGKFEDLPKLPSVHEVLGEAIMLLRRWTRLPGQRNSKLNHDTSEWLDFNANGKQG